MADILPFKPVEPDAKKPHVSGSATCQQCRYRWEAVAPVGTVEIQCPKCLTMKGLYMYGHEDPGGSLMCECLCQVFTISRDRVICWRCGREQILP